MMKIVIDIQGMQNGSRHRGIGRYVSSWAKEISRILPSEDLLFLVSDLFPDTISSVIAHFGDTIKPEQIVIFSGIGPTNEVDDSNEWRRHASEQCYSHFIDSLAPDILLIGSLFEGASDNSISPIPAEPRPYKVGVILYDLIPLLNPQDHLKNKYIRRWYNRKLAMLERADFLLAISESARQEAIDHTQIDPSKITTIGAAASDDFSSDAVDLTEELKSADAVQYYYGIERPFLMHTSAFEERKNFLGLIRAFAGLPDAIRTAHQLLLVCKINDTQRYQVRTLMSELGLSEHDVIMPGYVPDHELKLLYRKCALFVFPSFHEGFGLPALEAMWCGAPTIGSNRSSIPEVIGREDALFDPANIPEMSTLMAKALASGPFRDDLLAHARIQCRQFSWRKTAERTLRAINHSQASPQHFPTEESLIAKLIAWPALNGPTTKDLSKAAKAIVANRNTLARAVTQWTKNPSLLHDA